MLIHKGSPSDIYIFKEIILKQHHQWQTITGFSVP